MAVGKAYPDYSVTWSGYKPFFGCSQKWFCMEFISFWAVWFWSKVDKATHISETEGTTLYLDYDVTWTGYKLNFRWSEKWIYMELNPFMAVLF